MNQLIQIKQELVIFVVWFWVFLQEWFWNGPRTPSFRIPSFQICQEEISSSVGLIAVGYLVIVSKAYFLLAYLILITNITGVSIPKRLRRSHEYRLKQESKKLILFFHKIPNLRIYLIISSWLFLTIISVISSVFLLNGAVLERETMRHAWSDQ